MAASRRLGVTLAALALTGLAHPAISQTNEAPLSVIDWLGEQAKPLATTTRPRAKPKAVEPAVATTGLAPTVTVTPLGTGAPREIGLVPATVTGLPVDIWVGSAPDALIAQIDKLPDLHLPAAQALLYRLLLAEARAPQNDVGAGDRLALARVQKLVAQGALEPAMSLMEQAGVTLSPQHFDTWMRISLLTGTEDRACATLTDGPHLTQDYGARILCAARAGQWENAALTFGSAQALGLMSGERLALLDRFLNPDLFDGADPLGAPRKMDPLSFRLFETIGEPLPTRNLPLPYAVADLRDLAGWKAQLEAAERLTRAGALPENQLLGLYTDRKAAASGGIWDRVAALQRFEIALGTGSNEAVAKTLPTVWRAMQAEGLGTAFAGLFGDRLASFTLDGAAVRAALEVGLLSPDYEEAARRAPDQPDTAFLRATAFGDMTTSRPQTPMAAAIFDGFSDAPPRADLIAQARQKQLGASILTVLALLEDGMQGDATALRHAIATLRALGLEDTARRAALQILLSER